MIVSVLKRRNITTTKKILHGINSVENSMSVLKSGKEKQMLSTKKVLKPNFKQRKKHATFNLETAVVCSVPPSQVTVSAPNPSRSLN